MAQHSAPLSSPDRSLPVLGHRGGDAPWLQRLFEQERARFSANPRLFVWQALWTPFWLGSNGPVPRLAQRAGMSRGSATAERGAGAGELIQANLSRLASRFWLSLVAGSILRGIWLGLLIASGWIFLTVLGVASLPPVLAIVGLAGIGAAVGAVYGVLHPIHPATVATMLDRTFALEERLTTAIDEHATLPARRSGAPVLPRLQLADAANTLEEVVHELPRTVYFPVREAVALLVVTLALLAGLFAHVSDSTLPALAEAPVPHFVPASERLANPQVADQPLATTPDQPAPSQADIQQQAQAAQQAREDLGVLGEAMQDHPMTKAASDALAVGDYPAASDSIRAAASDAPNASQEEREALAGDLETAADQIASTNPDLADSSRKAADDLRKGGSESGEGLNQLADSVDETAGVVAPKEQGGQESAESQSAAQGNPGGAQPGTTGQESQAGGEAQQQSGSSQGSSSASDPSQQSSGEAGDPGEGVVAEPGVANQEMQQPNAGGEESGEMSGASTSGQSQSGAGGAPNPEGTGGAPGSDQVGQQQPTGGQESSSADGAASDAASQGMSGAPQDETTASQGSGAGTGQTGANDQAQEGQQVGNPSPPNGEEGTDPPAVGEAGDPPPGDGAGSGSAGEIGEVGGSNSLTLQGTSDEGVRTGGTSGSSSVGSGAGSGAASGDQVQQQVGVAGPDANRVPDGMQDVVQDFFTEPGAQP